ncbi:hypothetical protein COE25_28350 [Bacillus sp. AFS031507]|nr:hypothetical protein COE25_28350 [Bacillus sp. AFS031507]
MRNGEIPIPIERLMLDTDFIALTGARVEDSAAIWRLFLIEVTEQINLRTKKQFTYMGNLLF